MLLSTRDSYLGFPLLLERPLEGLIFIFSTYWLKAKATSSVTTLFLLKYNVVLQGVVVQASTTPFLVSYFRGGSFYSSRRLVRRFFKADFHILASGQASPIISSAVQLLDCVILECICSERLHRHFGGQDFQY